MSIVRTVVFVSVVALGTLPSVQGQPDKAHTPRAAIFPKGESRAEAVVALMEARLSRSEEMEVLDRRNTRLVLAEQNIALENAFSGADAFRVGQALGCDLVCELTWHSAKNKEEEDAAGFIVFDAVHGVRILDEPFPASLTAEEAAERAVTRLAFAWSKLQTLQTDDSHAVSIWTVRNVALPKNLEWVPDAVGELLARRLVGQPNIALLERACLDLLKNEYALTGKPLGKLLLSTFCLDVDVSKTKTGHGIHARISVTDIAGKERHAVVAEGTATDLSALTEALVTQLSDILDFTETRPAADWYVLETRRLARSGGGRASIGAARAMAETAFALYPAHRETGPMLCTVLQMDIEAPGATVDEQLDALHQTLDVLDIMDAHDVRDARGRIQTRLGIPMQQILTSTSKTWLTFKGKALSLQTDDQRSSYDRLRQRALKRYLALPPLIGPELGLLQALADNEDEAVALFLDLGAVTPRYDVQHQLGFEAQVTAGRLARHTPSVTRDPERFAPCDVALFSEGNIQKLLHLYETSWRHETRLEEILAYRGDWRLNAAMAHAYLLVKRPDLAEDPEQAVRQLLRHAADLAMETPTTASGFVSRMSYLRQHGFDGRRHAGGPLSRTLRLQEDLAVTEVERVLEAFADRRLVADALLLFLDWFDSENAPWPGAHIERAVSQLQDDTYEAPQYTGGRLHRLSRADSLAALYERRYGRPLVSERASEAPSLEPLNKLYACDEPTPFEIVGTRDGIRKPPRKIQGQDVSTILSAKARGDRLYLLIGRVRVTRGMTKRQDGPVQCILGELDMATGRFRTIGNLALHVVKERAAFGEAYLDSLYQEYRFFLAAGSAYFKDGDGLVRMELKDGQTSRILDDGRLPMATLSGLAGAGGKLYLGVKDYFVRCNPDGSEIEILAAAHRALKQSSLDNRRGWSICGIALDERGHRLLFPVRFALDSGAFFAYDLASGKIARLEAKLRAYEGNSNVSNMVLWYGPTRIMNFDGDRFPVRTGRNTFLFDPDQGVLDLYAGPRWDFAYALSASKRMWNPDDGLDSSKDGVTLVEKDGFAVYSDWNDGFRVVGVKRKNQATNPSWDVDTLDGSVPVLLTKHDDHIVAVTRQGVWQLAFRPPSPVLAEQDGISPSVAGPTGRLTVRSPVGGTLTLNNETPYRIWPNRPLNWSQFPAGEHSITSEWWGRTWNQTVQVKEGEHTDMTVFPDAGIEKKLTLDLAPGVPLDLAWVPPGEGKMGDKAKGELTPVRMVEGFWMGITEVTVRQYRTVMGLPRPDVWAGDIYAATTVSYKQAKDFCRYLTERHAARLDGKVVRLPTEDEWEYACRAGGETLYCTGESRDSLIPVLQHDSRPPLFERADRSRLDYDWLPLGRRMPNGFGLHGMCAGVSEWCIGKEEDAPVRRFGLTGTYRAPKSWPERPIQWYDGFRIVIAPPVE